MNQEQLELTNDTTINFPDGRHLIYSKNFAKYSKILTILINRDSKENKVTIESISFEYLEKFINFFTIMEESPLPNFESGNLDFQFRSLNPRYIELLDSLISKTSSSTIGGGGGESNGDGNYNIDFFSEMINVAEYVDCMILLKLFCAYFCVKFLNGKSADQVRNDFGIVNDFSPEEQAAINAEEAWLNS